MNSVWNNVLTAEHMINWPFDQVHALYGSFCRHTITDCRASDALHILLTRSSVSIIRNRTTADQILFGCLSINDKNMVHTQGRGWGGGLGEDSIFKLYGFLGCPSEFYFFIFYFYFLSYSRVFNWHEWIWYSNIQCHCWVKKQFTNQTYPVSSSAPP